MKHDVRISSLRNRRTRQPSKHKRKETPASREPLTKIRMKRMNARGKLYSICSASILSLNPTLATRIRFTPLFEICIFSFLAR